MIRSRLLWATCTLCLIAGIASGLSAQSARTNTVPAVSSSDELLAEVRALRGELSQVAGASIRTQMLVARLQLQEHRINSIAAQLQQVRQSLTAQTIAQTGSAMQLKLIEDAMGKPSTTDDKPEDLDAILVQLKAHVAQGAQIEQQLRLQENDLAGQLAAEQGRWLEFSDRLDALERSLPGTRQ